MALSKKKTLSKNNNFWSWKDKISYPNPIVLAVAFLLMMHIQFFTSLGSCWQRHERSCFARSTWEATLTTTSSTTRSSLLLSSSCSRISMFVCILLVQVADLMGRPASWTSSACHLCIYDCDHVDIEQDIH